MTDIKLQIEQLVADGNIESALNFIFNITANDHQDAHAEVILISSRWKKNETDNYKGIISNSDYNLERNRIINNLLSLPNSYDNITNKTGEHIITHYLTNIKREYEKVSREYINVYVAEYKGSDTQKKDSYWFDQIVTPPSGLERNDNEKIIILGDPGSGKSTSFQRAVWDIASRQYNTEISIIPIYVELNSYKGSKIIETFKPYQKILYLIAEEWNRIFIGQKNKFKFDINYIENLLSERKIIFFFDGLNEVGEVFIEDLLKYMREFVRIFSHRGHKFFFSTRKLDFEYEFRKQFNDFHVLEILEFNNSAINEFILRDLGKINILLNDDKIGVLKNDKVSEILEKIKENKYYEPNARIKELIDYIELNGVYSFLPAKLRKAEELISLLHSKEKILQISQNPSILKDIIDTYEDQGNLPLNRSLIFECAIKARFNRQSLKDGYLPKFETKMKLNILQKIGFYMLNIEEGLSISKQDYLKIVSFEKSLIEQDKAIEILDEITFKDGFLKKVDEKYSFVKQPYQEFFAAKEIKDIWINNINRNENPLKDNKVKSYFKQRRSFQTVALISGLLNEDEALNLINNLQKKRSTQRLAAMCIQNTNIIHEKHKDYIKSFIKWIDKRILFFAFLPDKTLSTILTILFMIVLAIGFNSDISEHSIYIRNVFWDFIKNVSYPDMNVVFAIASIAYSICCWLFLKILDLVTSKYSEKTQSNTFTLFISIIVNLLVVFFSLGNEKVLFLQIFAVFINFIFSLRIVFKIIYPIAEYLNRKIEDFFIYQYLIPSLEVMRDIGSHAKSTMISTQAVMNRNQFMSERVKNIIDKTWYISPQTFLIIKNEDTTMENKLGERIKNCEDWIMSLETTNKNKSEGIQFLFDIIDKARDRKNIGKDELGSIFTAIETLAKVAQNIEIQEFKDDIVNKLHNLVRHEYTYNYKIRSKARSVLKGYGLKIVPWPQSNIIELLIENIFANPFAILIIILIAVLLYSWTR